MDNNFVFVKKKKNKIKDIKDMLKWKNVGLFIKQNSKIICLCNMVHARTFCELKTCVC